MVESVPKLHAYKHSTNLLKILVTAKFSQYALEVLPQEATFRPKEVVEGSDTNTYPLLETSEGKISETSAIVSYIGEKGGLSGATTIERALIAQWVLFGIQDVSYLSRDLIYPIYGFFPHCPEASKNADTRLKALLKSLNNFLNGKQFLVGNRLTIADIELWFSLKPYWQLYLIDQFRTKQFPNIEAWFVSISNTDAVKTTIGRVALCKNPIRPPKVEKKEEKKEVKKEAKKEEKTDEEPQVEEKKEKKEVFPESKLDFDAFKKDFMNSTDRKAVLDKFFAGEYDANAFSIFYIRYQKLDSEGKKLFMTENGRDGFLERAEPSRKYVFASLGIYGEEGDLETKGVWLWRGTKIPTFFLEEHAQFEFYDKKQLDPSNEADKKVIYDYWLNIKTGDEVDGLKVQNVTLFR